METRVAIVGSRNFPRLSWVRNFVDALPEGTTVVSGGARGVDRAAIVRAKERGLPTIEFEADWSKGKGAGLERNTDIVNAADFVVGFWDGESRGTQDTMTKAAFANKPRALILPEDGGHITAIGVLREIKLRAAGSSVEG